MLRMRSVHFVASRIIYRTNENNTMCISPVTTHSATMFDTDASFNFIYLYFSYDFSRAIHF